jgi:hypothetical protein
MNVIHYDYLEARYEETSREIEELRGELIDHLGIVEGGGMTLRSQVCSHKVLGMREEEVVHTECGICWGDNLKKEDMVFTECNHGFCGDCMVEVIRTAKRGGGGNTSCPLCRGVVEGMRTMERGVERLKERIRRA